MIWSRLAIFAVCVLGCRSELTLRVNRDQGFLVVARHERQRSAITETAREVTGWEVTTSGAGGTVTLSRAGGFLGSRAVTYLIVSRPGFELFVGPAPEGGELTLAPTTSWRAEALATLRFERETQGLAARPEIAAHLEARRAHLRATWPAEVAAEEAAAARRVFVPLPPAPSPCREVLVAAVLPDGGLARLCEAGAGRALSLSDAAGRETATVPLAHGERGYGALFREAGGLALLDAGRLRRFDLAGRPAGELALDPPPEPWACSLSLTPDRRVWVGVDRRAGPAHLGVYGADGRRQRVLEAPEVTRLLAAFPAPDGAALVHGDLAGSFDYGLRVAGLAKRDGMPRGLVRLSEGAPPRTLITGIDAAAATEDGVLAYAGDLHAPDDQALVGQGFPGLLRQVVLRLDWEGRLQETRDVSDRAMEGRPLRLAQPHGARLVFYEPGTGSEAWALSPR